MRLCSIADDTVLDSVTSFIALSLKAVIGYRCTITSRPREGYRFEVEGKGPPAPPPRAPPLE